MEIKTLKYFKDQISEKTYAASFSQIKNMVDVYQVIDICDEAAIEFAKQFIDLAADKLVDNFSSLSAYEVEYRRILDIKQLIK